MSNQNQIQLSQQADSLILSGGLRSLQQTLFQAAETSIREAIGDSIGDYTDLNMRAMVVTEALRLTSGMDLTTIITRGELILQIEREGLVGVHPNGYANLTALATENGVSVGEYSDIRALVETVFPYIQNVLQLPLAQVWEEIGKSSFREMVPALRSLITANQADHHSVRGAVEQMLNTAAISLAQENDCEPADVPDAEVRRRAIQTLLHEGATLPTRQLRRRVRPSPVPAVEMATLRVDEASWYAIMKLDTQEQRDLVQRILNSHVNNMNLDGRGDGTRDHRRALGSFFGDQEQP